MYLEHIVVKTYYETTVENKYNQLKNIYNTYIGRYKVGYISILYLVLI